MNMPQLFNWLVGVQNRSLAKAATNLIASNKVPLGHLDN